VDRGTVGSREVEILSEIASLKKHIFYFFFFIKILMRIYPTAYSLTRDASLKALVKECTLGFYSHQIG
jgi:hypothetical protein